MLLRVFVQTACNTNAIETVHMQLTKSELATIYEHALENVITVKGSKLLLRIRHGFEGRAKARCRL